MQCLSKYPLLKQKVHISLSIIVEFEISLIKLCQTSKDMMLQRLNWPLYLTIKIAGWLFQLIKVEIAISVFLIYSSTLTYPCFFMSCMCVWHHEKVTSSLKGCCWKKSWMSTTVNKIVFHILHSGSASSDWLKSHVQNPNLVPHIGYKAKFTFLGGGAQWLFSKLWPMRPMRYTIYNITKCVLIRYQNQRCT